MMKINLYLSSYKKPHIKLELNFLAQSSLCFFVEQVIYGPQFAYIFDIICECFMTNYKPFNLVSYAIHNSAARRGLKSILTLTPLCYLSSVQT
jgi:hypothetical protein